MKMSLVNGKIRKLKYQILGIPMLPDIIEEALKNKIDELKVTEARKRSSKTNSKPPYQVTQKHSQQVTLKVILHCHNANDPFLKDKMGLEMGGISNKSEKASNESFEKKSWYNFRNGTEDI